ncbi:MAG: hypothetical protein OCD00_19450 [Colwellia sp.]
MFEDSPALRTLLSQIYPTFIIESIAKQSGQRVVFFGYFRAYDEISGEIKDVDEDPLTGSSNWGQVVLKVSQANSRSAITYMDSSFR